MNFGDTWKVLIWKQGCWGCSVFFFYFFFFSLETLLHTGNKLLQFWSCTIASEVVLKPQSSKCCCKRVKESDLCVSSAGRRGSCRPSRRRRQSQEVLCTQPRCEAQSVEEDDPLQKSKETTNKQDNNKHQTSRLRLRYINYACYNDFENFHVALVF